MLLCLFILLNPNHYFSVNIVSGEVWDSATNGIGSRIKELGFSQDCISQSLSACEKSVKYVSILEEMNGHLSSLSKEIKRQNGFTNKPHNCADILRDGDKESGVRTVYPYKIYDYGIKVFCDQKTDGGGWTIIQHREDLEIREDFFRTWIEYKLGFGNLTGEFWLGLDKIHSLVSNDLMELRVDLEDYEGDKRWAKYSYFYITDGPEGYRLYLGDYDGDAGDGFLFKHKGRMFSTKDRDNDIFGGNCAVNHKGAYWYSECHSSNINGMPYRGNHSSYAYGITWASFRGANYSLKKTSLMLRPTI